MGKVPVRHSSSRKNRCKALHFAKNLRDEIVFLEGYVSNIRYMRGRIEKLINRLRSETKGCSHPSRRKKHTK
jgi:hypothetical protein